MIEDISLRAIPQELKFNGLWCCWRKTDKGKIPYNVKTGGYADSSDPDTFVSYAIMLSKLSDYLHYDADNSLTGGVGLGVFRGYSAVDIDHCVDDSGNISAIANDIIEYFNSYTELSPSKHGVRIIFKTNQKYDKQKYYIKNSKIGLEIYISDETKRFVTITGNTLNISNEIATVNLTSILDRYMLRNSPIKNFITSDAKLRELYNGKAPGAGADESERDASLCCKLAYYLNGDYNAINEAFMSSPYYLSKDDYHKQKWLRDDYKDSTINGAISLVRTSKPSPNISDIKQEFELNDTGNSRRFVSRFGNIVKYNVENMRWMIFNGKHWQPDIQLNVKNFAEIIAEEMKYEASMMTDAKRQVEMLKNVQRVYNTSGKEALLKEAQHIQGVPCINDDFDRDIYALCCENGVVDLRSGILTPHDKNQMISMTTGHEIDMYGEPTEFLKFLREILSEDDELFEFMHRALGYSITNATKEQCMFVFYGDGRNGKSLLQDIVRRAVGSYAITTRPTLLTEQRNGNSNTDEIARLKGKHVIFCEETKVGDKLDESLIKTLTSGIGNVVGRFLYGSSFEFAVTGKIIMSTNHRPIIRGTDNGIWRRIHVIPFLRVFDDKDDDKNLVFKLENELPQILGWLVKGAMKWYADGLGTIPNCVKDSTKEYRSEMDIVQRWIDDRCEIDGGYFESGSKLFEDFTNYTQLNKEYSMSNTLFGRNLVKKFPRKRYGSGNVYMGIRLRKDVENIERKVKFEQVEVSKDV